MKVFISWSGLQSKAAGLALRDWLPKVLQNIEIWMSDRDIPAGAMWLHEIMEQLKEANFGIVCITPENRDRSWIHFEAGAIAKAIDNINCVCPYLISMRGADLQNNPLSNFQYKQADEKGTKELIESINKSHEKPLELDLLRETFDLWWPKLSNKLNEIPEPENTPDMETKPQDILGEVLEGVRRIERSIAEGIPYRFLNPSRGFNTADMIASVPPESEMLGQAYPRHIGPNISFALRSQDFEQSPKSSSEAP
jgi:hypothetical protein